MRGRSMAPERRGWIAELFARRVPQIVGVYIGACWMTVEIGDWVTERVGAPPDLIAYVFVLMIALLPSVAVLAWNHGAPGKDRSPRFEKLFVPANLVAALVAVVAFFGYAPPGAPGSSIPSAESAVVERTVVDETGTERTFTVARAGFHRLVFTSFYGLDEGGDGDGRDWRRYAAAWLVMVALNRDPLISVVSPYRNGVASDYIEAGYPDALGEPRALAVRQAQRIGARYVVRGGLSRSDSGIRLRATVIEAESGAVTGEVEADGADLVEASAALALELRPLLAPDLDQGVQRFTRVPLAEAATPSRSDARAETWPPPALPTRPRGSRTPPSTRYSSASSRARRWTPRSRNSNAASPTSNTSASIPSGSPPSARVRRATATTSPTCSTRPTTSARETSSSRWSTDSTRRASASSSTS